MLSPRAFLPKGSSGSRWSKNTVNKAIDKGLLVISAGSDVLRMVPPLVITKENVDEMIEILSQCL